MDVSTIVNIILCVLSFILAVVSVVTVVITLRQNNRMIEESTRPFISVYTDEINTGNPFFYLVVKNFGKSTAYITKFEYDFDFNGCYKIRNDKDYLQQLNNAVLAPGQSRSCTLDYQRINKAVTFTLEYHSGAKKTYSDKFTMDLKAGVSMPYGKVATEGKELRTISYALQENFMAASKLAQQAKKRFVPIVGYGYGKKKTSTRGLPKFYMELAGKDFWTELTGDEEFYIKLIRFMDKLPEKYVEEFDASYQKAANRLVREFTQEFCFGDGSIDWEKLVEFNSGN